MNTIQPRIRRTAATRGAGATTRLLATLIVTALVLTITSGPSASDPAVTPTGPSLVTNPAADPLDLADYLPEEVSFLQINADLESITLQEAADRYGWHERLSLILGQIEQEFPADFAGETFEPVGSARAWVAFKATAPAAAIDRLEQFPYPVAVYENRGFSEDELDERLIAAHHAVVERHDLVADASSSYDVRTGLITIAVKPTPGFDHAWVVGQLSQRLPQPSTIMPIQIRLDPGVDGGEDAIYGGLTLTQNNGNTCTSGFTVRGVTTRGSTTAAHCNSLPVRRGSDRLVHVRSHRGDFGDVAWHYSTTQTHTANFNSSYGVRHVSAVGTPKRGQRLCRHGITTGTRCDDVSRWLNACAGAQLPVCRLVATERRQASGGDSGGPWFSGTTAHGIHQGRKQLEFRNRDVFSQARYIPNALGHVTVLTN